MANIIHFYRQGNAVTDCLRPLDETTGNTWDVLQVTCKACQKTHTFKGAFRGHYGVRFALGEQVRVIATQEVGRIVGFDPEGVPYMVQFGTKGSARLMEYEITAVVERRSGK